MLLECRFEVWDWFKHADVTWAISQIIVKYGRTWSGASYAVVTCPILESAQRAFNVAYQWTVNVSKAIDERGWRYVGIKWWGPEKERYWSEHHDWHGYGHHQSPVTSEPAPIAAPAEPLVQPTPDIEQVPVNQQEDDVQPLQPPPANEASPAVNQDIQIYSCGQFGRTYPWDD